LLSAFPEMLACTTAPAVVSVDKQDA